ncbi:MAG: YqaE/Pmp3 family membrane protein [Bacteroidales bacterium]
MKSIQITIIKIIMLVGLISFTWIAKPAERAENLNSQKSGTDCQLILQHEKANITLEKMTMKEKLKFIREVKKEIKKARKDEVNGTPMVILYILAIILPPVAVGIFTDWGEPTLWNLLFTLLFWFPGIIHAFYILLR